LRDAALESAICDFGLWVDGTEPPIRLTRTPVHCLFEKPANAGHRFPAFGRTLDYTEAFRTEYRRFLFRIQGRSAIGDVRGYHRLSCHLRPRY